MDSKFYLLLSLVCLLGSNIVSTAELEFSGLFKTQIAINTFDMNSQSIRFSILPELVTRFDNGTRLTTIALLSKQSVNGLRPEDNDRTTYNPVSRPVLSGATTELELREFFFETAIGKNYLTLGKQQVVWGKADGLKVLDVVNPQSFQTFILDDFEDSRIPLWTVNYEWQLNDNASLQFLWIPDQTMHALPKRNAKYTFTTPRIVPTAPAGVTVILDKAKRPSRVFKDSDFGLRWTAFVDGWDLTLNYLYHYDDLPVFYQQLTITPAGVTVLIKPQYKRSHLVGGTFSNAFGDLTIRGELGYSTDKYFLTTKSNDSNGVVKNDEFAYVLGFDWFGLEDSLISFQLFQSIVVNPSPQLTRPNTDTTITLLLSRNFFNETLNAEILFLHNLNDSDGLMRPKVAYEWLDNVKVWLGLDIFYGTRRGLFGEFSDNDRVVAGVEIGF